MSPTLCSASWLLSLVIPACPTISTSITHFFFCPQSLPYQKQQYSMTRQSLSLFPRVLYIRWPMYRSCGISPSNEYLGLVTLGLTGLISWLSKSLKTHFQQNSSKPSVLWHSTLFIVRLSHP